MMLRSFLAFILTAIAGSALAQISTADPWVRATVPQQRATGAFMRISSAEDARLVAARSPVAGVVEVHEMWMDGNVMKMRRMSALALPAGQMVELKPGAYHIMLIDLKQQMKEGDIVPLTLDVVHKDGRRETVEVQAPVRPLAAHGGGH